VPAPQSILLVDDNTLTLLTLTRILQQHGYSVLGASDGAQALQLIEARPIDLIIMDYNLPGSRGELGPAVKRLCPQLPLIVLSGDPEAASAAEFADLLLAKPQDPQALVAEIQRLLAESQQQKAA
jgi:CheY-like chemotaxis protein